eukprot:7996934-Karenia_brevis.AAC.1
MRALAASSNCCCFCSLPTSAPPFAVVGLSLHSGPVPAASAVRSVALAPAARPSRDPTGATCPGAPVCTSPSSATRLLFPSTRDCASLALACSALIRSISKPN